MTTLPIILESTSPTHIGLTPGPLSKGISRHADKVSRDLSEVIQSQCFCVITATDFLTFSPYFLKHFKTRVFLQPSASILDEPEHPLVATATLSINDESISAYIVGWIFSIF